MTGPVRRQDGDAPESEAVAVLRELVARVNGCSCPCDCDYDDILDRAEALLDAAPETRTGPSDEVKTDMRPTGWWRVAYADGYQNRRNIWCETPNEQVAQRALKTCPGGGVLLRLYDSPARNEWREVPSTTGEA